MEQYTLSAQVRDQIGTQFVRKMRNENQIPAVFYGPASNPTPLTINVVDLEKIIKQAGSENMIIGLEINRKDNTLDKKQVMLKELQVDPIKDSYIHADFYEIRMDQELMLDIPVALINTPKGVKEGGILQHIRRELTVSCLPDKIVDQLELDVSELDIGDTLHIGDIHLPDGIKAVDDENLTVVTVIAPTVPEEEEIEEELEGEETEEAVEKTEEEEKQE
jgi:large subunit ribosomal protein L25